MVVGMSGAVGLRPLVEVMLFHGCPHYQPLLTRMRRLLQHSHLEAELVVREVTTEEVATAQRFLGSPAVRVNGVDIDPRSRRGVMNTAWRAVCVRPIVG
jgi:hypothetical protein